MPLTSTTLSPIEAYEELMRFASRFGEAPLRLAFHAAVPQSFRLDLLHLIRRNFVPEAKNDPTVEADLLLSPLCKDIGRGYFQFDPNVRYLLLDNLAESYSAEPTPRIQRVANLLLHYTHHFSRLTSGRNDRLWRDYLETQRWVALAFVDPENAAQQFAENLRKTITENNIVTRLQLGGLASSLSTPLAGYSELLNYASAQQSLETEGPGETAQRFGDFLEREITVGNVTLRPLSSIIRERFGELPTFAGNEPLPPPEIVVDEVVAKDIQYASVYLSFVSQDRDFARKLAARLKQSNVRVWFYEFELNIGDSLRRQMQSAVDDSDFFAVVLSKHSIASEWVRIELENALNREIDEKRVVVLPILLEKVELPPFLKEKVYADFTTDEIFEASFQKLLNVLVKDKTVQEPVNSKFYPNNFIPDLKFFVGREELLENLKNTLEKGHRASIHDISGIGKTFTTYKFADQFQNNYERIFFVRANKEEMLKNLAEIGVLLNPFLKDEPDQSKQAMGFKDWLEKNDKWLVIYDDVDIPDDLFPFVPLNKEGDCIFTSNYRSTVNLGEEVSIEKLDKTDAEKLLFSRSNNFPGKPIEFFDEEEQKAFEKIVEEIDGHPLSLNTTSAFISENGISFEEFYRKLNRTPEILVENEDGFDNYQNKSASKAFSAALGDISESKDNDEFKNSAELAETLLFATSFIAPDNIPEILLQRTLQKLTGIDFEAEENEDLWQEIRRKSLSYDLLKYDKASKLFNAHRLIQTVIQTKQSDYGKETILDAELTALDELFEYFTHETKENCELYAPHAIALVKEIEKLGRSFRQIAGINQKIGRFLREITRYQESIIYFEKAIAFYRESQDNRGLAFCLNELALVYQAQGRYDEAIELYKQAIEIDEKTLGTEHPDNVVYLNNLANVYTSQNRYDEAIEFFKQSVEISAKTLGREHPDYAFSLNNLARVYYSQGRYDDALELFERALVICEKTFGREHPNFANYLSNLALVYEALGEYRKALEFFEQVNEIFIRSLGENHPSTRRSVENVRRLRARLENKPPPEQHLEKWIYVICDKTDLDTVNELEELIIKKKYSIFSARDYLNIVANLELHSEYLNICDGVVIYWNNASIGWILSCLRDLPRSKAARKHDFLFQALFCEFKSSAEEKNRFQPPRNIHKFTDYEKLSDFLDEFSPEKKA